MIKLIRSQTFRDIAITSLKKQFAASRMAHNISTQNYDSTQVKLLDEPCILVDETDREIGTETKKNCHLLTNIGKGMLHRAFSVFLFDENKNLLLQQRALSKITYPNHWTNACCSHPLFTETERDSTHGVKVAAVRRLNYELGIDKSKLSTDSLEFLTRIQYKADNIPHDGIFGEHEIDYVLLLQGKFDLNANTNEVKATRFVSMDELRQMIEDEKNSATSGVLLTPWFKLIADKYLFNWWRNLDNLELVKDQKNIHKFS
jgi:isopentenyl-diphosphate delta-isomerase